MEDKWRWSLVAAIGPIAWGSSYYVTAQFLPIDHPLWGAAIRAVPAGFILLAISRRLPRGSWWWRSLVLGTLNMGAFFALVYLAAQLLPTSLATTIMAMSSAVMLLAAWALLRERPRLVAAIGAALGLGGVCLLLLSGVDRIEPLGVVASLGAMLMSSIGYVLATKWGRRAEVPVLASTAWQLLAGGLVLVAVAIVVEGSPPEIDVSAGLGFAYVSVVATAVAFASWFAALQRLGAGVVGLIGLLNPVTGVLVGIAIAGETLTCAQLGGLALVLIGILLGTRARGRPEGPEARTPPDVSPGDDSAGESQPEPRGNSGTRVQGGMPEVAADC